VGFLGRVSEGLEAVEVGGYVRLEGLCECVSTVIC
jgi:hypothetical protein